MQFIPYQEPEWQKSLSGLVGTLGNQGSKAVGSYFESKNRKELEKKDKEKKEAERTNLANAYAQTGGMSYEQAYALANTPPDIQKAIVQQMLDRGVFGPSQEMGQQGMGAQGQMQPGMPQSPLGSLEGLASPQQQQVPYGGLTMSNMAQSQRPENPGAFLAQRTLQGAAGGQQPQQRPMQQGVSQAQQVPQKPVTKAQQLDKELDAAVRNYDIDQGIDMAPTNIGAMLRSGMTKEESKAALTKMDAYDDKLSQEVKAGKSLTPVLKRMNELVEKDIASGGKLLRTPAQQEWLKSLEEGHGYGGVGSAAGAAVGGILGGIAGSLIPGFGSVAGAGAGAFAGKEAGRSLGDFFTNTEKGRIKEETTKETQEFEKLSAEFIKGAKGIFGSRITDQDLQAFMRMVPTLSNTNEGKLAVLRNIELVNEATLIKGKIRDKIVKANGGRRPYNLETMVEDISGPKIDQMAAEWKKATEEMFEKYGEKKQPQEQKSMIPGLPGGYDANEL